MKDFRIISVRSLAWGLSIVALALMAAFPSYAPAYWIVRLTAILMYVILTVSWAIFSGPTGYVSLASAAFFGVGIYTSAVIGKDFPLAVIVFFAGVLSFCLAAIVGLVTLRLKGIYFAIFTFGLVELIKQLLLFWEINITGTRGRFLMLVDNNTIYYYVFVIFVVLMVAAYLIKRSRYGLALQSIGEHEEAAAHMGINVTALKIIVFSISAFFMGAVGSIMAFRWTYIDPYVAFNALFSFMPVLMAIFGGMGHLFGPVLGAAIFAYLEEILLTRFQDYFMLTFGIILVIAILFLPDGLIGLVQKVWNRVPGKKHAYT
jgi:branched-chain amino acid transport system permease protein